jgi:hypothetical protein
LKCFRICSCLLQGTSEVPTEHAGFLMALGLNGHLTKLAEMNTYDYLIKCHEMTSVGLLLGVAATKRGKPHANRQNNCAIETPPPRVRSTENQRKQTNTPRGSCTLKQLKALLLQRSVRSNWERLGCKGARQIK